MAAILNPQLRRACTNPRCPTYQSIRPLSILSKRVRPSDPLRLLENNNCILSPFAPRLQHYQWPQKKRRKAPALHRFKPRRMNLLQYRSDSEINWALKQGQEPRHIMQGKMESKEEKDAAKAAQPVGVQVRDAVISLDDFGILPGTPIVITRAEWPRLLFSPRQRLRMEYDLAKRRAIDLFGVITLKFQRGVRNFFRMSVSGRKAKQAAVALHYQLNQALAEGNLETVKKYTRMGLQREAVQMLGDRKPGTNYRWQREGVRADLISNRAGPLPATFKDAEDHRTWVHQAVVRIRSKQSLVEQKFQDIDLLRYRRGRASLKGPVRNSALKPRDGEAEAEDTDVDPEEAAARDREMELMFAEEEERQTESGEYDELFVIQRSVSYAADGEWKVWGTTKETSLKDWAEIRDPNQKFINQP